MLVGGEQLSMSQTEGRVHVRSLVCPRLLWSGLCHPAFQEVIVQPYEGHTP